MKILYYDCFSGISGDMNLGALLDLGVSRETLISGLQELNTGGWKLDICRDQRHGITGTKVTVIYDHDHRHDYDHDSDHGHNHDNGHDHGHETFSSHAGDGRGQKAGENLHKHRNLADIEKIVMESGLKSSVKELAMKIFRHIAVAEAAVHDKPVEEIHFHEVGAIDSIVDIVGAAICLDDLEVDRVYVSEIELGGGMVRCQHGLLPVPAPATERIISGFPVHTGGVGFEATTPTGAAIIAATAEPLPISMKFTIRKSGYGIGHKNNPSRPNILRVFLAETVDQEETGHQARLVECNIDDMNPETSEYITGRLFEAGAGDVWFTPVIMKKGRPAFTLSVICEEDQMAAIREIIFTETTTIGLRVTTFTKETLHREFDKIETRFGLVLIKKSYFNGKLVSVKPEADRCAEIARTTGLPMKQVMDEIYSLIRGKA